MAEADYSRFKPKFTTKREEDCSHALGCWRKYDSVGRMYCDECGKEELIHPVTPKHTR